MLIFTTFHYRKLIFGLLSLNNWQGYVIDILLTEWRVGLGLHSYTVCQVCQA
jgi:hypothetical protein